MQPFQFAGEDEVAEQDSLKQHNIRNTAELVTPYLGLRARLSQVWINRWTVLLFLVLARILLAVTGLNHSLGSAKSEAMSACSGIEAMGSTMASMPHYLAAGMNELTASGVEKAVHGLISMLLLTITGLEELIVFYINMLTSTYLCLITLLIRGSLHAVLQVIEDTSNFLNTTLKSISHDIGNGIAEFTSDLNGFTSKLNSIPEAFGDKKGGVPTININSSLDKLDGLQLPNNLDHDLTKLNASIPTFADVQNFTDNVIRFPFEEVKKLVNDAIHFSFNRSLLSVPAKEHLVFCSDNDGISRFFDGLFNIIQVARRIFVAVLTILAILVCAPMAYLEIRRWRVMRERANFVRDNSIDPLDVIYIASRPYTAAAGVKVATLFKQSRKQVLTRWAVAYVTSNPALLLLSLGMSGLLACTCQLILIRAVEREVPVLANDVGDYVGKVVSSLENASATWANTTNGAIKKIDHDINHDIFGWVNTTTIAVNDTLNAFIDETTKVLNATFSNTILYDPVTELFSCLLGLKVAAVQRGLTWVSEHAKVEFPSVPNNTFSFGVADSLSDKSAYGLASNSASNSFLADPGSEATDKITAAIIKVTSEVMSTIRTEAIISTFILCLWIIILLAGSIRAIYLAFRPQKVRGIGGTELRSRRPFSSIVRGPAPAYESSSPRSRYPVGNQAIFKS